MEVFRSMDTNPIFVLMKAGTLIGQCGSMDEKPDSQFRTDAIEFG